MKLTRANRGLALLVVLFLLAVLGSAMTVFTSSLYGSRSLQRKEGRRAICGAIARAGVERAVWELARNPDFRTATGQVGEGTYEVTIEEVGENPGDREVSATGFLPEEGERSMSRHVRARVRLGPTVEILEIGF